jgi:hypothetical protein
MFAHLRALQDIADAKGFGVSTPQFDRLDTVSLGKPAQTLAGRSYQVDQASLLIRTPPGGLTGQPVRPTQPSGCAASDYPAVVPKGAIAVVDDTRCSVVDKQNSAVAKGSSESMVSMWRMRGACGRAPGVSTSPSR